MNAAEALDALQAVREALDIPHAATVGDEEIRAKILNERIMHTVIMLRNVLDPVPGTPPSWKIAYLRERLAEHPATGYKTWDEAMAELKAAKVAGEGSPVPRCCRCRTAPVHQPGALRPDGYPQDGALYCAACIDRCHEATDFAHVCVICAGPDELASGLVPGAGAAWREAVRQAVAAIKEPEPEEEPEPEPEDYDPGPEVDDEGGMSEYRYTLPDDPRDADFTGGYRPGIEGD